MSRISFVCPAADVGIDADFWPADAYGEGLPQISFSVSSVPADHQAWAKARQAGVLPWQRTSRPNREIAGLRSSSELAGKQSGRYHSHFRNLLVTENLLDQASWPTALVFVLLVVAIILGGVIWSIRRHRDPKLEIACDAPIDELMPSIAGLTQGAVYHGNSVELLADGAFFVALFRAIESATRSIHFETFLWKEGELGTRLADALAARCRAGVAVRVLVDADGGKNIGTEVPRHLREAGCRLRFHHPRHIRNIGVFNDRDHRKLVVLDGTVAFVGGHCIVDGWMCQSAARKDDVRDLGVRLEGPAVHAVQAVFAENWVEDTGELFLGDAYFPSLERTGEVSIHVASIKAEGSPPAVKILHHLVICMARERLWIQNPYFLPDDEAIEALCVSARRGVDVRVMVPSAEASDMPMVQHAAHRNFHRLLEGGVRIFEFQDCLLHQKMMTVDGVWSAIGSSNFDDRSLETNDEITLGIKDATIARRLEASFMEDMQHCVELDAAQWAQRGFWHRCKDGFFHVFNELL